MTERKEGLDDLLESLRQQRDELRVQMHLAGVEAKQEWERLEKKWTRILAEKSAESKPLREAVEESTKDVSAALEQVAEELKRGYQRIRDSM